MYAGWDVSAGLAYEETTIGRCRPSASLRMPTARLSLMPSAHLLIVLKVAGATRRIFQKG
jgi:hypothetical protein